MTGFPIVSCPPIYDAKIWLLYPGTKLNLRDRVSGEVEENSFIAYQAKDIAGPENCVSQPGGSSEEFLY